MARLIALLVGVGLVVVATSPVTAAVWRCHTPTGDVWTDQPQEYDDCEEFAGTYYPHAEPPAYPSPPVPSAPEQVMPPPPPPTVYESAPPPLYPPYYDPYYYSPYGPGVYVYPPWFGFRFGHGRHFGGHRFGGERGFARGHGGGHGHSFGGGHRGGHR